MHLGFIHHNSIRRVVQARGTLGALQAVLAWRAMQKISDII